METISGIVHIWKHVPDPRTKLNFSGICIPVVQYHATPKENGIFHSAPTDRKREKLDIMERTIALSISILNCVVHLQEAIPPVEPPYPSAATYPRVCFQNLRIHLGWRSFTAQTEGKHASMGCLLASKRFTTGREHQPPCKLLHYPCYKPYSKNQTCLRKK